MPLRPLLSLPSPAPSARAAGSGRCSAGQRSPLPPRPGRPLPPLRPLRCVPSLPVPPGGEEPEGCAGLARGRGAATRGRERRRGAWRRREEAGGVLAYEWDGGWPPGARPRGRRGGAPEAAAGFPGWRAAGATRRCFHPLSLRGRPVVAAPRWSPPGCGAGESPSTVVPAPQPARSPSPSPPPSPWAPRRGLACRTRALWFRLLGTRSPRPPGCAGAACLPLREQ